MSAPPEPTADVELARLLNVLTLAATNFEWTAPNADVIDARAALLAHIAATYVRRDDPRYRILDRASESLVGLPGGDDAHRRQPLPPLTPTPADVDAGRCRWTEHGWEWTDYRAVRGILPWREGNELPEERIRRLRDAEEAPGPPIVAGPLSRVPVTIRRVDASANDDRATWPLRAIVGDRRYGGDTSGRYNVLDCGHESSVLHGGTPERMPDGGYGKRCRRCAAVIDHNEAHDYDVRD